MARSYEEVQKDKKDAQALLNNPFWPKIWVGIHKAIERREQSCDTSREPNVAADIIRCKQLLKDIETVAKHAVKRGDAEEEAYLKEIKKKTPIERVFRR